MKTLENALLALALLSCTIPGLADARRSTPKYGKTATVFRAQQGKQLSARFKSQRLRTDARYQQRLQSRPKLTTPTKPTQPVVATPSANIKDKTTKTYISRALHQQASLNYYVGNKPVRVTNVKINDNKMMFKDGGKYVSWTAKVNFGKGDSYNAKGFVRTGRQGQPKGTARVKVQSSTPAFGISIR